MYKTSNTKINIAVIGCGHWGKNLVRNFQALGALSMVCDSTESGRAKAAELTPDTPVVNALDEVLARDDIPALAIATPAETHFAVAKRALLAGKDVFVEKPLCLSDAEGGELLDLAAAHDRILMVGHLLQYHPCIEAIQNMVESGELGKLYTITSNRLNLGKIRQEENALWSFAPHDISVILSLTGDRLPESVICTGTAFLQDGICDATLTAMTFTGGVRAHVYVSWLNPFKEQKLTVVGSDGMVVFDDTRPWNEKLLHYGKYLTWNKGSLPTPNMAQGQPVQIPEEEPLRKECQHFLVCCQTRTTPKTDAAEGLRVLQTLNLAQFSLNQHGTRIFSPPPPTLDHSTTRPPDHSPLDYFAHPTACVDDGAKIGAGTKIWHFSHIMKGATIGERCIFGLNVNVDGGVVIGNNVKVQNNVSIYTGAEIEDDVFLGPSCVLTNVTNPRSQVNRHSLYEKTLIRRGATVGANATIVCGVTLGRYCFIGAGAVVTKDVPDYGLMLGNPARQKGWMSRHGHILKNPNQDGIMVCPESGYRYQLLPEAATKPVGARRPATSREAAKPPPVSTLRCLDLPEESRLPPELANGIRSYNEYKS